ncbi:hypothetical protein [Nocardioides pacificus]
MLRTLRAAAGALLGVSGGLMYAASWQRWAGACAWGQSEGGLCDTRQDDRYDFLPPSAPWEPVGDAAQLAGASLLVLAVAFVVLPWALAGRRPGVASVVASTGVVLALGVMGASILRSGLAGSVVQPFGAEAAGLVWALMTPVLLARFAAAARGWTLAAAVSLVLSTPLVAVLYAIGPYDTRPWWEAISGAFTAIAGVCLLGAAACTRRRRSPRSVGSGKVDVTSQSDPTPSGSDQRSVWASPRRSLRCSSRVSADGVALCSWARWHR